MDLEELLEKIKTDPDFVIYPSLDNSLKKVLKAHPDGMSDQKITKALMMTEEDVKEKLESALEKIREALNLKE
jgi:hypothetical protein